VFLLKKIDLEATGENLLGQITSNDSDLSNVASNLVSSGQNLQTQITSNDTDISTNVGSIATNATNIASNTTNLAATGQALQREKLNVMGGTISGEILPYESGAVNLGSPLLPFRSGYFDDLIVSADSIQIGPDTTLSATAEGGMSFNTVGTITFGDVVVTGDLGVSGDFTLGDTTTDRITTRGDLFVLDDAFFADAVEITGSLTVDGTASAATPTQNSHLTTKLYVDTDITIVSGLITNNDTELNSLRTATGVLKTSTDNNATNIASNDSDIATLTTNLASTGQNLQANISTNVGAIATNVSDISTLTTNLASTGNNLQVQVTSNDGDISTLTSNLISTGQTLQTQITSNDSDISTITSNLVSTGQTLNTDIITVSGLITNNDTELNDIRTATGVLKTSTDNNATNIASNDSDIATLTTNLTATGSNLQAQVTSLSGDAVLLAGDQTVAGNKTFSNDVTVLGDLAVSGDFTLGDATTDRITTRGDLYVEDDAVFQDDITVTGDAHFAGSVGIGTAAPSRLLTLENNTSTVVNKSQLRINNTGAGDSYVYMYAGADWSFGIDNSDGDKFKFNISNDVSDGTEVLTLQRDGKVGIGTTAPAEILEVVSDSDPTILIRPVTVDSANSGKISYRENAGGTTGVDLRYDGANNKFIIDTSDVSNALVIKRTDGKVGIGTDSPTANFKLDVEGDLMLGETGGTDNSIIDQKQNGSLYLINSGATGNSGRIGINKWNTIAGGTTLYRDFIVYDGKNSAILTIDGSAGSTALSGALTGTIATFTSTTAAHPLTISGNSDNGDNSSALSIIDTDSTGGSKLPAIMFYGSSTLQGRIRGGDGTFAIAVGSTPTTALSIDTGTQAATFSGNITMQGNGLLHINSPTSVNFYLDRSAANKHSSAVFQTAGVTNWAIGLTDSDSSGYNGSEFYIGQTTGASSSPALSIDTSNNATFSGALSATTKSFLIDHPTKPGKKLRHGSLEGPENGVYIRGRGDNNIITLPEYWTELVNKDSITVQLTPIGKHQHIYVEKIQNNTVYIQSDEARKSLNDLEYYYLILAERKDVNKLTIEE